MFHAMFLVGIGMCSGMMLSAQRVTARRGSSPGIAVGSDFEEYLRYLQTERQTPFIPLTFRPLSPTLADSLATVSALHPWRASWLFDGNGPRLVHLLPLSVSAHVNSAYPYGINEGPVWSGKGLTSVLTGGISLTSRHLTIVLAPAVFRAENAAFALQSTGLSGRGIYADPLFPTEIDQPQRFGNSAYTHVDPGESTIRLDVTGISVGATSANEWWGPASFFPYIVGNNAAGVPRVFFSTEHPTPIWVGQLQLRVEYGLESQSAYSPVQGPDTYLDVDSIGRKRVMSALVMTFVPRGIPTLELGFGRYFHRPWIGHLTASDLKSPLEGLVTASPVITQNSNGATSAELANQLASGWLRWVFPGSGVEVYGEYGHEDHNIDMRDLTAELDHSRAALVGMRKVFGHDSSHVSGVRAEIFDGTASTVARHRGEGLMYVHNPLRQGHTEEGKVIGSAAGIGSPAGAILAWDHFHPSGKWTLYALRRTENTDVALSPVGNRRISATIGGNILKFANHYDLTAGIALVRSTRTTSATGGWNLNLTAGSTLHGGPFL